MKVLIFIAKNSNLTTLLFVMMMSYILQNLLGIESFVIRLIVMLPFVFLLPRKSIIKTQNGEKIQINWIFLKKPVIIEE